MFMVTWQIVLLASYTALSGVFLATGLVQCRRGHAYGRFLPLNLIGAFVWGDAVVFGLFWVVASSVILLYGSWWLFLIVFDAFWLVRSIGETIYWLNQQYSTLDRNPPRQLWFYPIFRNNSVWFVYQTFWQCISVITLILLLVLWRQL